MNKAVPLTEMMKTKVYDKSGTEAGTIAELIIDPSSGIVRFATVRTLEANSVLMPWAAMVYTKAKEGFVLTHRGESILHSEPGDQLRSLATKG